jgi:hypothetical protein
VLDLRAERANAILSGSVSAADSDVRFVILGRQELNEWPDCELTVQRGDGASAALRSAGWEIAFEHADMRIFARPDDPVVAQLH